MGDEADALSDRLESSDIELDSNIERYISDYNAAKSAAVGNICNCPVCRKQFKKSRPDQAFAPGHRKCKDRYHNTTNETRKERALHFSQNNYDHSW
jgi:hypothetical protein